MVTIRWSCLAFHWASNSFQQPFFPERFSLSFSSTLQNGSISTSGMTVWNGFTGFTVLLTYGFRLLILFLYDFFWLPDTSYNKVNMSRMTNICWFWMPVTEAVYRISFSEIFLVLFLGRRGSCWGSSTRRSKWRGRKWKTRGCWRTSWK